MSRVRRARGLVVLTVVAVVVEVVLGLAAPGALVGTAGEAIALVWLALVARRVVAGVRPPRARAGAPAGDEGLDVAPPLHRLRRAVETGTREAGQFHVLLRPVLRRVAAGRLRRHGVELDADERGARALLGDEGYALVRPDRAPPEDRFAAGPSLAAVERLVERMESL